MRWYAPDYDTEVHKADPGSQSESDFAHRICGLINNYQLNETHLRLRYPDMGTNSRTPSDFGDIEAHNRRGRDMERDGGLSEQ